MTICDFIFSRDLVMASRTSPPFALKYTTILKARCYLNKEQRIAVLRKANTGLIKCICECALNILIGNVTLQNSEKKKLKNFANTLRKLSQKIGTWKSKKSIIIRQGKNFFSVFLKPIINTIFCTESNI